TDGAIGKRTTATVLTAALNAAGIHTVMVGTGQTGLMQGAAYGVALDAIPAQFGIGELEGAVVAAWEGAHPQVIVIEGQGALSHPAYVSSTVILRGARPQAVILQHAPARAMLSDYPDTPMPTPASEIALIELFARTRVIGLTINHENMDDAEVSAAIAVYEADLSLPATDALTRPAAALVDMVVAAFPALRPTEAVRVA
ncbi:MAG: NAD-dependent epimerase/dehydratase family protein, partial [Demequina sp.]